MEFLGAGAPGDFWAGMALDSFSTRGRTDFGIGMERVCLDDPTNDLTACGFAGELRGEWHLGVRTGAMGEFDRSLVPLIGISAGAVAGPAHDYYDYTGALWAGVRWQRFNWPFAVHVAAVGRQLVAGDGFDDRTVGGLQVGLAFR